jgi:SAM-dependent methyltransferase
MQPLVAIDPLADLYAGLAYAASEPSLLVNWLRPRDKVLLDVGCGTGIHAARLSANGVQVHGLTLSEDERQQSAPYVHRAIVANVETWQPDYPNGFFDAILLSHVLEHLVNPALTLKRLQPLLNQEGRIYIGLPNIAFWRYRWRALLGRFDYEEMGPMDRRHLRFFTFYSACRLAEQAGLRVVRAEVRGHFPLGPVRRWFPRAAAVCDRFAVLLFPNLFGYEIALSAALQLE